MSPNSEGSSRTDHSYRRLALVAVERWPLEVTAVEAIKVRENAVFRLDLVGGGRAVLRVHRLGYHSDASLLSEICWMRALEAAGVEVPRIIPSLNNQDFERVADPGGDHTHQVDALEWIEGRQLGSVESGVHGNAAILDEQYVALGALAAGLHNHSSHWPIPAGFVRHAWDSQGIVGDQPLWGRFWRLDALQPWQRTLLLLARSAIREDLDCYGTASDRYGLIHADLVPENILVDGSRMRVIDFDDTGFGWHMFDLATCLYCMFGTAVYTTARDALFAGYSSKRPLPSNAHSILPLFLAARATTYLGWMHSRRGSATADMTQFVVEKACQMSESYLASR